MGKGDLKRRLGVAGTPVALFCGSLQPHKRLNFLFDAALRLRQRFTGFTLVVLGDGECAGEVRSFADAHDWVHYVGRIVGVDRAQYFAIADVLLMPGLVGLVLLDSFAAQVPLMTTDLPFHSPEIGYLRHAENGWCSPSTIDAYVDDVSLLLSDDDLRRRLHQGCAEAAERYPLEQMVSRFSDGILRALQQDRRRAATR
jgi:glycosyltransferase involved in cell wall biosynthesis